MIASRRCRPVLLLFILITLPAAPCLLAEGVVENCTEADLRAAMSGGGTVTFACDGTIVLNETLHVTVSTALDATGRDVTLSGGGARRLFLVESNATLTGRGLNLIGGHALGIEGGPGTPTPPGQPGLGGCILNLGGTVVLEDCLVSGHVAEGGRGGTSGENPARGGEGYGGAICNQGGHVTVNRCTFTNNRAVGGPGSPDPLFRLNNGDSGDAVGGAIYADTGLVEINASTFSENKALGGAPQYGSLDFYSRGGNASGGAIGATNSMLVIRGSILATNAAISSGSPWSGRGTGIAEAGAAFVGFNVAATVSQTVFVGNLAQSGSSARYARVGAASGGAVLNRGNLRLSESILTGNLVVAGSGVNGPRGEGGAIASTGTLTVNGSTFDRNSATGSSGLSISGVSDRGYDGAGGAIWSAGNLNVTNATFTGNRAQGGNGDLGGAFPEPGGAGLGGALQIDGGTAALANLTLANNVALGGGVDQDGTPPLSPSMGAGLGVSGDADVSLLNTILAHNSPGDNAAGSVTDAGYNLSSDSTPLLTGEGSLNNSDPLLGPLSDNGGFTPTMALLEGSPALDAIPSGAPPIDQRGVARPQGPGADIGAYEACGPPVRISLNGENVVIMFEAEAGHHYELLRSTNFTSWETVDSQTAETSGTLEFIQPLALDATYLYRLAGN